MYKRILVATDGTALSKKAVAAGIDMALLCNAELVVVNVVERYATGFYEGLTVSAQEVALIENQLSKHAQAVVEAATDEATRRGVQAKGSLLHATMVADAIIAAAKRHKAGLIVMASHGRRGVKRLLLGSETQQVLTHSTVPVLVLRPHHSG